MMLIEPMDLSGISNKYLFLDLSSNLNRIFNFGYKSKFQKAKYFVQESELQLKELIKRLENKTKNKFIFESLDKMLFQLKDFESNELSYELLDDLVTFSAITQHAAKQFE